MANFHCSPSADQLPRDSSCQLTTRHLFVLAFAIALGLFAFLMLKRATMPSKFLNAARDGEVHQLRTIIGFGMDVQYRDGWRTTALMMACSQGHTDCVQLLIDSGADPNERSRFNRTPLIWASESGNINLAKLLIENGASVSAVDDEGFTASDHARENGNMQIAAFLELQ